MRIARLKETIAGSRIIDESKIDTSKVQLMNKVKIKNLKNNAVMTYTLVSESEADLKAGKISITTPIAKGLMGKKVGEKVDIKVPSGVMPFEIIDISL
jgi:transcription elongation factor GreA